MQISVIGDYELTRQATEPTLVIHHVVRGYDVVHLDAAQLTELSGLLAVQQKRIRTLGPYQVIFGESGDLTIYTDAGRRACYFNADQAALLNRFLA